LSPLRGSLKSKKNIGKNIEDPKSKKKQNPKKQKKAPRGERIP